MKVNMKDLFNQFSDETVDIHVETVISPDRVLQRTREKIKEDNMIVKQKKVISIPLIAAVVAIVLSVTAFASYRLLSVKDIVKHMEDERLSEVFSENDTRFDFAPQVSGAYTFHLLGIASGKGLSKFTDTEEDKSYVVGAVTRTDGNKMYDFPGIMITPLVSGYKPWEVNAFTIGGGRSEFISDDGYADYFVFECDNIEVFADHTVYIAMYDNSEFMAPGSEVFTINPDGSIQYTESYKGAHALFTLPLDSSKADPAAAQKLLLGENDDDDESGENTEEGAEEDVYSVSIRQEENGEFVVEKSQEENGEFTVKEFK